MKVGKYANRKGRMNTMNAKLERLEVGEVGVHGLIFKLVNLAMTESKTS
jgi:hypothetical protein